MANHVHRSRREPIREGLSWSERWGRSDAALITCWEAGRELAEREPELATRARRGELPVLAWKGGVEREVQVKKYGTLRYLALWQGLRGDNLDIDPAEDLELTCSSTGVLVTFTADRTKWAQG